MQKAILIVLIAVVVVAAFTVSILTWKVSHLSSSEQTTWPRDLKLLRWSPGNYWTLDRASCGLLASGATGSGKSSGIFQYAARTFLRAGFSAIFLVCKQDAIAEYVELVRSEGREKDLIIFSPHNPNQGFNFVKYAAKSIGGKTIVESLLQTLMQGVEICSRQHRSRGDAFFEDAMKNLLRHCLLVVMIAKGEPDIGLVLEIVQSLPQNLGDVEEPERFRSLQLLEQAEVRVTPEHEFELGMARRYFTWEWPTLSDRTRSSIAISLSTPLDAFLRYPLRQMFLDKLTVSPDTVLAGGVAIIAVPTKTYGVIGQIAGCTWKYEVQKALERRPELTSGLPIELIRPVCILADEAQAWATHTDAQFAMTARSARGLTVYCTQSVSNFYGEMGGDATTKAKVDSLLANLQTRVICQNLDATTNQFHADSLGKIIVKRHSRSVTVNPNGGGLLAKLAGANRSVNEGESEQLDYELDPHIFPGLKKGGVATKGVTEAILVSAGDKFRSGRRWVRVSFDQFKLPEGLRKFFTRHVVITVPRKKG